MCERFFVLRVSRRNFHSRKEAVMADSPCVNRRHKYPVNKSYFASAREYGNMRLIQIGRMCCSENTVVEKHTQLDFIELTIVRGGRGLILTNDVPTEVASGDIYVSFPGDVHEIISDKEEPLKFDFIAAHTTNEALRAELDSVMLDFHSPKKRVIRDGYIPDIVSRAILEESSGEAYSSLIMESMLREILIYVVRDFAALATAAGRHTANPDEAELFCYRIMNYIDSHVYSMESLSELSKITKYNYNYLSNLFKEVTGCTLMNYYRRRRLETARLLLTENTLSITRIARLLGYSSVYTFSRAYKEYFGENPSVAKER